MSYRDERVKILEDRRRRCRPLVKQIQGLPWTRISQCDFCHKTNIVIIAVQDRYGIPLQVGLCRHCGLVFLLDRLTEEGYSKFYRSFYRPLLSTFFGRPIDSKSIQNEQLKYASELASVLQPWLDEPLPASKLLDIGGSTGIVAQTFVDTFGYEATVIDPSPAELDVAREKGLKVVRGFIETYNPPEPRAFDLVLMCQTIDHLQALCDSMAKVANIIKRTGYFFVDIVDFDETCRLTGAVEGAIHLDHCYYLSLESAIQLFSQLGWQIIFVEVAIRPGHVGFLLQRSSDSQSEAFDTGNLERLQRIQRLHAKHHEASRQTYGVVHWLRRRLYRMRRNLAKIYKR